MHITKPTYQFLSFIGTPKIHAELLWGALVTFLMVGVLYVVALFFTRNKFSPLAPRIWDKGQKLAQRINAHMYQDPTDPKIGQKEYGPKVEIKEPVIYAASKKTISKILYYLQKNVVQHTCQQVLELYKNWRGRSKGKPMAHFAPVFGLNPNQIEYQGSKAHRLCKDPEWCIYALKTERPIWNRSRPQNWDTKNDERSNNAEPPSGQQSIFYPLYHHTDDMDVRSILLKELVEVGDEREIPFLKGLLTTENRPMTKMAQRAMGHLTKKLRESGSIRPLKEKMGANHTAMGTNSADVPGTKANSGPKGDIRIPLEHFFLYEALGVESWEGDKEERSLFEFELSEEFFMEGNEIRGPLHKPHV